MGEPLGTRATGLAYRVFRHVDPAPRGNLRHPWWRHGSDLPARRDRAIVRGDGKGIRTLLASHWLRSDQQREDVQITWQLFYDPGNLREVGMVGGGHRCDPSILSPFNALPWSA